ncbi:cation transporter [Candidatus Amesbacteria bacterium]|nr:cation transporter [Candidatus Amesbacteria bacterium]
MTKKIYKLTGLHCTSCSMVIEGELEDQLGVRAVCNWAKQMVEIEGEADHEMIVKVIEGQGYKVVGKA